MLRAVCTRALIHTMLGMIIPSMSTVLDYHDMSYCYHDVLGLHIVVDCGNDVLV